MVSKSGLTSATLRRYVIEFSLDLFKRHGTLDDLVVVWIFLCVWELKEEELVKGSAVEWIDGRP